MGSANNSDISNDLFSIKATSHMDYSLFLWGSTVNM